MTTLTLGTASFGMPGYGIASQHSVTPPEAVEMMYEAARHRIALDTGAAYGNAESLIGGMTHRGTPHVTTKLWPATFAREDGVEAQVRERRDTLALPTWAPLTVLFHTPAHGADRERVAALRECRDGLSLCTAIGTSIYDPEEFGAMLSGQDVVQLPYNVLDRRCAWVITEAKARGMTVQVRAPFCQGLLFLPPTAGPAAGAKKLLTVFREVCAKHRIGYAEAALRFALDGGADTVVFGVDDWGQLAQNIDILNAPEPDSWQDCREELERRIPEGEATVVNPSRWASK